MVRESLARKFHPAGFEQPEDRRGYSVSDRLNRIFYQWVDGLGTGAGQEEDYKRALDAIKDFEQIPSSEATSLLVGFKKRKNYDDKVGLFISACYTKAPEDVIVFDQNAEYISFIGYRLRDKILINEGSVGPHFAMKSACTVINNGNSDLSFARASSGLVINNGHTENFFAESSSGTVINNSEAGDHSGEHCEGLVINNGKMGTQAGFKAGLSSTFINNGLVSSLFCYESRGLVIFNSRLTGYVMGGISKSKGAVVSTKVLPFESDDERVFLDPGNLKNIDELESYLSNLKKQTEIIRDPETAREFLKFYGSVPKEKIRQDIEEIIAKNGFTLYES